MKLKITSIADRGNPEKERIVMRAMSTLDVGLYALVEAGYADSSVNTFTKDVFWFPDKKIDEGDYVVLYTKSGNDSEKRLESGRRSHFFYWGKPSAKWGTRTMAPVLMQVESWQAYGPDET